MRLSSGSHHGGIFRDDSHCRRRARPIGQSSAGLAAAAAPRVKKSEPPLMRVDVRGRPGRVLPARCEPTARHIFPSFCHQRDFLGWKLIEAARAGDQHIFELPIPLEPFLLRSFRRDTCTRSGISARHCSTLSVAALGLARNVRHILSRNRKAWPDRVSAGVSRNTL